MTNFQGQKIVDREKVFWSKINIKGKDGCWEYISALTKDGYGRFWIGDRIILAHIYSWELKNGPTPQGKLILHKCDNPPCCNEAHLYCGTYQDNQRDRSERHPVPPEVLGNNHAKLYRDEIQLVRSLKHKHSANYIANTLKCSTRTIYKIWNASVYLCKEGYYI